MAKRRTRTPGRSEPAALGEAPALAASIAAALGPWFARAHRDLSWRRTRDPYAIWVSEIMLQQTRVETVERYYPAFVRRFPDVGTLAAADEEAVLEAWSGLGYYRRARLLHRGARHVHGELAGEIPSDATSLRKIPGVGRYTAGAIASIAFDRPAPMVDGNVARVFSRLRGIEDTRAQTANAPEHWTLAEAVMQRGSPRILAQALMELGATVCTPRGPRCGECPVEGLCRARADDRTASIPAPRERAASPVHHFAAVALVVRRRLLLIRRPAGGLLGGLWCLPLVPAAEASLLRDQIDRLLGAPVIHGDPLPTVRHVFTHRVWELHPWPCASPRRPALPGLGDVDRAWIAAGERPTGGIPRATEKLLEALER